MAHDVFISHSSKDKAVADAVCATLEQHHVRCWIAPRDIGPGAEWGESIVSAIHTSRVMVLIFSASANESPQIRREVERAVHNNVVIVPMRIEDVLPQKSLEYFIGAVHWLDAFNKPMEDYLESLAGVVKGILGGPEAARVAAEAVRTPKKTARPLWPYVAGGIVVVLILAVGAYTLRRKSPTPEVLPVPAMGGAAAASPPAAALPSGMTAPTTSTGVGRAPATPSRERSSGAVPAVAAVHVRSEKQTISVEEAKVMVVTHNYYRANWNAGGKGLAHQYETKAVQGALVVVDRATDLMWQRGGSGEADDPKGAEEYVRGLNAKKYGGFDDWRLPTLEEAMSLMTPSEKGQPADAEYGDGKVVKGVDHIDPMFENSAAPIMWTADLESPTRVWVVYFWDGICTPESIHFNAYVRAVRSLKSAKD